MKSESNVVVGVDIGGTKVAAGLVDANGEILVRSKTPMATTGMPSDGLAAVSAAIRGLFPDRSSQSQIAAIGICAPGPLNPKTGVIINPPNLAIWHNYPLAEEMRRVYSVRIKVDNDANAGALAEAKWGAARGYQNIFYACVGTGIGTGIVFDGRIYHGKTGAAGEGGHTGIDSNGPVCNCGKRGCIEILAAGPAIGARARSKFAGDSRPSAILDLAKGDVATVTSEMVGKAYAVGDPLAREILQETVELLTVWLGNIVDLLDPDVVVMGGGVAAMLKPFFDDIKNRLPGWCVNPHVSEIPLLIAHYGADAGIAGGAALCSEDLA